MAANPVYYPTLVGTGCAAVWPLPCLAVYSIVRRLLGKEPHISSIATTPEPQTKLRDNKIPTFNSGRSISLDRY